MNIDKAFSVLCSYGILTNNEVSHTDLRVYLYIKFRWQFFQSRGADFCESASTIAFAIGQDKISVKTIRRSIENLERLGYLETVVRPGKTSLYIPKDDVIKD